MEATHTYQNDNLVAVADNIIPSSSSDEEVPRWTSWRQQGRDQWIEITLDKPTNIQSISIYWFDDGKGTKVPLEWSLEYEYKGQWKPFSLYLTDAYHVFKDQFNMVHPGHQIIADKVRILMKPQPKHAVGILEINVEEVK